MINYVESTMSLTYNYARMCVSMLNRSKGMAAKNTLLSSSSRYKDFLFGAPHQEGRKETGRKKRVRMEEWGGTGSEFTQNNLLRL